MNIPLKRYWDLLIIYLRPQKSKVAVLAILLFIGIGAQLTIPQLLRMFIDTAQAGVGQESLVNGALLFLGAVIIKHLVAIVSTYISQSIGWNATNALRVDLATHCLKLDMSFHTAYTSGELIERIDGDIQVLSNFFSQFILIVVNNLILMVGVLVLLCLEDWRIGSAYIAFTLIALLTLYRIRSMATADWRASSQARADMFGLLEERLSGIVDIRANGATSYVLWRLLAALRTNYQKDIRAWLKTATLRNIMILFFVSGGVLALGLGAFLMLNGSITVGTVYLIYAYSLIVVQPLERITKEIENLQAASASIVRIEELFQIQSQMPDNGTSRLPEGPLAIEFRNVSFGYDVTHPVLHDLSFHLEPGTVLGLLGRTGSGKTSITRLLMRLYEPTAGQITIGGVDLRAIPLDSLRQRIGIVTQDVQLFRATVRDNLTLFNPDIPDEEILEVLRNLGLWTWFATLPAGLDTELASGGGNLSSGEAQLLAFARVFLKKPSIVILDEASSRLDPATQQMIQQAITHLFHNRTGIVIAHRLETIQQVDEIIILEEGRICEQGRRVQMMNDSDSLFSQLLRTGLEEALA